MQMFLTACVCRGLGSPEPGATHQGGAGVAHMAAKVQEVAQAAKSVAGDCNGGQNCHNEG